MRKLLALVILLALGFNGFSETPQTTQEILSRPVFPKVDYEDVELKTTLRHLFQRPECRELGLSYGIASDVKGCRVTIKEQQINLFQFLNLMCLQSQLNFSFKDNLLHFYNDTRAHSFSQTTTGNQDIDLRLSQIIIPKIFVEEVDYFFLLRYLNNEVVKYSGTDKKEFIFTWKYDENHSDKYRINASFNQTNLLTAIREICRQGNLKFRYADGILLFVPGETPPSSIASGKGKPSHITENNQSPIESPDAQQNLQEGMSYYEKGEYAKAFQYFLRAAEQGSVEGQYRVGKCHSKGEGTDKDLKRAFNWYQKSADAGYADALLELGHCYYDGRGTVKDGAKAVESYQKAIEKGNLKAYASLGGGYLEGRTISKNLPLAIQYLQKGATLGERLAQYNLGYCYHGGRGVKKAFSKAVFWFKKSAEQGFALAQFSLATCYFTGDVKISSIPVRPGQSSKTVTGQNYSAAVIWYRKAAEQGYLPAQDSLGVCYYNGLGVKKDIAQAAKLWADAAEKGDNDSQYRLATCYQNGTGIPRDSAQANYWFKKSAANGNKEASAELKKASAELKLQNLQKLIPATNSKQEGDIAYSVIERMAQGRTLEEIFSDPGLQTYTRQNRYLRSLLEILRGYEKNPPPTDYILAPATEKARRDWKEFMGE